MTIAETVAQTVKTLSIEEQQQVLDFVIFLQQKQSNENSQRSWQNHPAIGIWKDRDDMRDSVDWVKKTRQEHWHSS